MDGASLRSSVPGLNVNPKTAIVLFSIFSIFSFNFLYFNFFLDLFTLILALIVFNF